MTRPRLLRNIIAECVMLPLQLVLCLAVLLPVLLIAFVVHPIRRAWADQISRNAIAGNNAFNRMRLYLAGDPRWETYLDTD